jgi:hypothetical protein
VFSQPFASEQEAQAITLLLLLMTLHMGLQTEGRLVLCNALYRVSTVEVYMDLVIAGGMEIGGPYLDT